jgi:hypothetical protein
LLADADELWATGDSLVIARIDNVGIMVEVKRGARERAEAVLATVYSRPTPWPQVPPLERTPNGWVLHPVADTAIRYQGGELAPGGGLRFVRPPTSVVVYDAHGRATRQAFDPMGLPVDSPTPWANHTLTERSSVPPEDP